MERPGRRPSKWDSLDADLSVDAYQQDSHRDAGGHSASGVALRHTSLHIANSPFQTFLAHAHMPDGGLVPSCVVSLRGSPTTQVSTQAHLAHSHLCTTRGRCASPMGSTLRHRCASPTAITLWGPCGWLLGRTSLACMLPRQHTWAAWMQGFPRGRPAHRGGTLMASLLPSPATATASWLTSSLRQVSGRLCLTLCWHFNDVPQDI